MAGIELSEHFLSSVQHKSRELSDRIREARRSENGFAAFLHSYDLSSPEGIALMSLAEALLRIPDSLTQDRIIHDKISGKNWRDHLGKSHSWFVNSSTLGLSCLQWLFDHPSIMQKLLWGASAPAIRFGVLQSVKALGSQFILGENLGVALKKAHEADKFRYSFDMLGESAKTAADADRYFHAYRQAIEHLGNQPATSPFTANGISVKLSALHPRFEWTKSKRLIEELYPRLCELVHLAQAANINLTLDAEESYRLEPSLDLIEKVVCEINFGSWQGFGLAIQAYQKRSPLVIDWLIELARQQQTFMMVRLVKGAYWDTEIKWAQERGLCEYPVFTRKSSTDVAYYVCAKKLLEASDCLYPQFATHNAYTVATILELAKDNRQFEFQGLHGMGTELYQSLVNDEQLGIACRLYAPVGEHKDLLSYLIRRILENGASTSFVHRIVDDQLKLDELLVDPVIKTQQLSEYPHPKIPLPANLYGTVRRNSKGFDLYHPLEVLPMVEDIKKWIPKVFNDPPKLLNKDEVETVIAKGHQAAEGFRETPVEKRASLLEKLGELMESHQAELMAYLIREGGKTVQDALSELREAVDFCRFYAVRARSDCSIKTLTGPTGEQNQVRLQGRGLFLCISPWNFPLAILMGQISAALASGNAVLVKPASQTVSIAKRVVALCHEAGFSKEEVQLLMLGGSTVGKQVVPDPRIQGVMLTGSTQTATQINQILAEREGAIVPFVAETGGLNAMIVDSSAFAEQVVSDVILSAFNSAGQRCSALRVLFLQHDTADQMITMLKGAMAELSIGDPLLLETDIGPVIDEAAAEVLQKHVDHLDKEATKIFQLGLPELESLPRGRYFAPCAYEIPNIEFLTEEVFGPILHIVRYQAADLDRVVESINNTGYGLTLGIHSRVDSTIEKIRSKARVGNVYVNRNMIGAVVGVQPFGGEGLSGTGPKAGGFHLLPRLSVEQTVSINTAAVGGNTALVSLEE